MTHNLLNYRPSNSAVYYTPPKKIHLGRTLIGFLGTAVAVALGSFLYAKVQPHLLDLHVRVGAVVVAALAVGGLCVIPIRYGRVRIPLVAAFIGAVLALLSLYVMWLVWLHGVLLEWDAPIGYVDLITQPTGFMRLIRFINSVGTWSTEGRPSTGIPLLICWLVEAGAVLACGVLIPMKVIDGDDPDCRTCGSRCKAVKDLPRFAADRADEFVAAVESRDFGSLAGHATSENEDDPELSLRLLSCPRCGETHVLTLNLIGWTLNGAGQITVAVRPLVNQLLITADEAGQLLAACKQVVEEREAEQDETVEGEEEPEDQEK